jgi:hypothetical protein
VDHGQEEVHRCCAAKISDAFRLMLAVLKLLPFQVLLSSDFYDIVRCSFSQSLRKKKERGY